MSISVSRVSRLRGGGGLGTVGRSYTNPIWRFVGQQDQKLWS